MATNIYAKLIDGIPTTTCAAEEDTDLIAQILADGFKPYDDSAPMPETGILKPSAPTVAVPKPEPATGVDRGANVPVFDAGSKLDAGGVNAVGDFQAEADPKPAATKLNADPLPAAVPVGAEFVDPATVVPVSSGPKIDITGKLAAPSLAEPIPIYRDDGDRIVLEWKVLDNSPAKVAAEIARLQSELAATDYQVIKCYEFALAGEMPPYDPVALHVSRQALRDRIGELEELLAES